jgi:hypothetical protein
MHWHQMSDTLDQIAAQSLTDAIAFTTQILQEINVARGGKRYSFTRPRRRAVTTAWVRSLAWSLAMMALT